jgi:hypothetical protein
VKFSFDMHDHAFVSIRCCLQATTNLAHLHRIFILARHLSCSGVLQGL